MKETCIRLNAVFAGLILVIRQLDCVKTEKDHSNREPSIPPSLLETSLTPLSSNTAQKIEPLSSVIFNRLICTYLTPELLSHSDPLEYLLSKLTMKAYSGRKEDASMNAKITFETIRNQVNRYLKARKFPRPYVPYAKLLYSAASCLARLNRVSIEIREFQIIYPKESNYPSLPRGISNPELRTLFDAGIFSDSNIPSVLLQKLVKIPSNKIANVEKNLKKVYIGHDYIQQPYFFYMNFLLIFFEDMDDLDSLRDVYLELRTPKLEGFK